MGMRHVIGRPTRMNHREEECTRQMKMNFRYSWLLRLSLISYSTVSYLRRSWTTFNFLKLDSLFQCIVMTSLSAALNTEACLARALSDRQYRSSMQCACSFEVLNKHTSRFHSIDFSNHIHWTNP